MSGDDSSRFAEKFSVNSPRLKNWDYSTPGIYFITICTLNHNQFLGKIINGQMVLSKIGEIINKNLKLISSIYQFITLDEFIIMPNHIHLILNLQQHQQSVETCQWRVSTIKKETWSPLGINRKPNIAINYWKSNSISSAINQFKSVSTKQIRNERYFFAWQPRFHDEIIKDQEQFYMIKQYIKNNPKNWEKDEYNS
jgi:REP element-mobilizing transposase RayT